MIQSIEMLGKLKENFGENERLLSPLRLAQKYNERTIYFDLIIAIAIDYAIIEEEENIDFFMGFYSC